MTKILSLITLMLLASSCKPENIAADFNITIRPEKGLDGQATTREDTPLLIKYEIEETEESIDLSLEMVEPPKHGVLKDCESTSKLTWQCIYIPDENYFGDDTVKFKAKDGDFFSEEASTVDINITPVPDNPIAADGAGERLPENSTHRFKIIEGSDVDSTELTYELVDAPANGTLQNCLGSEQSLNCEYIPNLDFIGTDSFTYKVIDETGLESESLSTVRLNIMNHPEIGADKNIEIGDTEYEKVFEVNPATDSDSSKLTYKIVTNPKFGRVRNCFGQQHGLSCSYMKNLGYVGADSIEYIAIDEDGLESNVGTINFRVAVKELPVIGANQNVTTAQATPVSFEVSQGSDPDTDSSLLRYVIVTPPTKGVLGPCFMTAGDRNCTYQPGRYNKGSDSFTYKVVDDANQSSIGIATVSIEISEKNAPTASNHAITVDQYKDLTFNIPAGTDSDTASNLLTYRILTQPKNGKLENCLVGGLSCKYTPNQKYYGPDSFTYQITDDFGLKSNIATVSVTVKKVNLRPTVGAETRVNVKQGVSVMVQVKAAKDDDTLSTLLTYKVVTQPKNGTLTNCFPNVGSTTCIYNPQREFYGTDSFTYNVTDNTGLTSTEVGYAYIEVERRGAPVAQPYSTSVDQYKTVTFNIPNAVDPDSGANLIKYEVVTAPTNGKLSSCFGSFGVVSCTYTPNADFYGLDTFTYKAIDEYAISSVAPAIVTIAVGAVNLPPTPGASQAFSVDQNSAANFTVNEGTDKETKVEDLKYQIVTMPKFGNLVNCFQATSPRLCTYVPQTGYYGPDSLQYVVVDGNGATSTATQTVSITVIQVQKPPVVGAPVSYEVAQGDSVRVTLPLGVDPNQAASTLSYRIVQQPTKGTLSNCQLGPNQSRQCTYTATANVYGPDTFTYELEDLTGQVSAAKGVVNINVMDIPLPVLVDFKSTTANTTLSFSLPAAQDRDSSATDLVYNVVDQPKEGTVSCTSTPGVRSCVYTPAPNKIVLDTFTYKVTDEKGNVSTSFGTVNIDIRAQVLKGIENFVQQPASDLKGVDFNWVIDNSGSMGGEQAKLAQSFSKFIDGMFVDNKPIYEFDMYSITSDFRSSSYNGSLTHTAATMDIVKFKNDFKASVNVGTSGSGSEKMYASAQDLITRQIANYHSDRLLVIINVSDEAEQSRKKSAQEWAATFQGAKEDPRNVAVFNIIRPALDNQENIYKHRYIDVANATGGKNYDIEGDFSIILDDISNTVSSRLDSFVLDPTRDIIESTVKVYLNGFIYDSSNYTYTNGAIRFNTPLADGDAIRVTYDYTLRYN